MAVDTSPALRIIFHTDIDAFFASVEQRDYPEYRGRPIVVRYGGSETIAAASYEAKAYGIGGGMRLDRAENLCPGLVIVDRPLERYVPDSRTFQDICISHCPEFEPYSVSGVPEEGWMDYTGKLESWEEAKEEGMSLRNDVKNNMGLTASTGIAYAKIPAKMASDYNKPDGLTVVRNAEEFALLFWRRGVRDIFGVGAATEEKLKKLGIETIGELAEKSFDYLVEHFKPSRGTYLYFISRGVDETPVTPYYDQTFVPKSIGRARTVRRKGTKNFDLLGDILRDLCRQVGTIVRGNGYYFRTVTLEMNGYNYIGDIKSRSRSRTLGYDSNDWHDIYDNTARMLYGELMGIMPLAVRKIGARAEKIKVEAQPMLFGMNDYKVF